MWTLVTNALYKIGGNAINTVVIDNLPKDTRVEVPYMLDAIGIHPTHVSKLPTQLSQYKLTLEKGNN